MAHICLRILAVVLWLAFLSLGLPSLSQAADQGGRLTLQEAIDLALKQHPAITESKERVASSQAQIGISRSALFPQSNVTSNYFYGTAFARSARGSASIGTPSSIPSSVPIDPGREADNFFIYRFNFNQLLWDFGKTPGRVAESRSGFHQSKEDYANTRQQVVLDARTAYFGVLAAQRAVKVEDDNVRQNQELLKQAQGFYQVGLRAKIDVTKAEANLYDAEASLIRAKNALDLAKVTLMTALGLKTFPYKEVEPFLDVTHQPRSLAELKTKAMEQRPDYLKNKYQQEGNEASIRVARAGYFPTLSSTAAYGWQGSRNPLPDDWWVGASLNFPFFEGGLTTYSLKQAKANLRATVANSEVLRQNITKEVEQAYLDLQTSWELIRATKKAMEAAQENFRLAQGRYKAGVGTIIEVTDAQVQLSRSELRFVQALYDYRVNEAKLDKAVGRPY